MPTTAAPVLSNQNTDKSVVVTFSGVSLSSVNTTEYKIQYCRYTLDNVAGCLTCVVNSISSGSIIVDSTLTFATESDANAYPVTNTSFVYPVSVFGGVSTATVSSVTSGKTSDDEPDCDDTCVGLAVGLTLGLGLPIIIFIVYWFFYREKDGFGGDNAMEMGAQPEG